MVFDESMKSLIGQALALAASKYVEFAADALEMRGGDRLCEQFRMQAIQAREAAVLITESSEVIVVDGDAATAHEDARRITAQEIIDVQESRKRAVKAEVKP